MKFIFFALLVFTYSLGQKRLSEKPLKENAVTLSSLQIINGGEEEFYNSISSDVSENGTLLIFDYGNLIANVYDGNGKLISSFGKEGNGPGEFNNEMSLHEINEHFVVFETFRRTLFF